jgi:cytidine deaminase
VPIDHAVGQLVVTPTDKALLAAAIAAQAHAHCPFSKYPVGAAVLTADGEIFGGCNVESASFSLTCCAERVAVFKAVSEGHQQIVACAIVTAEQRPVPPCGACRQVLFEFGATMRLVLGTQAGDIRIASLGNLLPEGFGQEQLLGAVGAAESSD